MEQLERFPLPKGTGPDAVGFVGGWRITSYFGGRPNPFTGLPSWHGGMDLGAPLGVPMIAGWPGQVFQAWDPGGGGWWTRLVCDNGAVLGYGHAENYAPHSWGEHVPAGDVLAFVDSTGASSGNHLHFAYQPPGWSRNADPYDLLEIAAAEGLFDGSHVGPAPDPGPDPQHPEHTPEEILVMHRFWTIEGEPTFYAVGLEPFLSPDAVGADGQPQSAEHYVGGVYVYQDFSPSSFVLAAGMATQPEILTPGTPGHDPIIAALHDLPRVYQAA